MPMMRRGPLDRYSPEWVLRQANAHLAEGSIEFHTDRPMTLYLQGGRAYAAEEGVNLLEQDLADRPLAGEAEARQQTVALLTDVLTEKSGWYFHDPLGQHPSRGSWAWETATLLMDTRAKSHETSSLAAWSTRTVVLHETSTDTVTLGADAWAIVVSLATSAGANELRTKLGWKPDRVASALAEMDASGVLKPTTQWRPPPDPADATGTEPHHDGAPAPPSIVDPSSHRRRVLPLRRTSGS
ncbi:hypothetical protein ACE2AJ_04055 [Aquihabitans daechungensis]|uniref:hypothetical protein n=1 Tax=Aquihabitans daechungensis TaxID=1052257 RepID=UPI003BA29BC2